MCAYYHLYWRVGTMSTKALQNLRRTKAFLKKGALIQYLFGFLLSGLGLRKRTFFSRSNYEKIVN